MDQWSEIRRRVLTNELSKRQACEKYQIHWKTLVKMLRYAEPPGTGVSSRIAATSWKPQERVIGSRMPSSGNVVA